MSKLDQVLQIDPLNELRFKGPFSVPVTSYMKLTNPSDRKVMFKIKTTAPKKYCVRPNAGILEPNSTMEVAICLQPFVFDPAEKNKHKFMVQTVFAPDGDVNLDQLWKEISHDQLMDSKLKCVFEMPAEPAEQQEDASKTAAVKPASNAVISNSLDGELQKAAAEVQQLREEESSLKQENLKLKEEILLLKQQVNAAKSHQPNRYAPPAQQQQNPVPYFIVAVVVCILGIIMGKFAL